MARKDTTASDLLQQALMQLPDDKLATLARESPDAHLAALVRRDPLLRASCFERVLQAAINNVTPEPVASRKGKRRSTKAVSGSSLDQRVLDAIGGIAGTDGVSSTQIAELVGSHKTQVVDALNQFVKDGVVKKTGKNKSTRYHLA